MNIEEAKYKLIKAEEECYVEFNPYGYEHTKTIRLDGLLTLDQLEAIVFLMKVRK